MGDHRASIKIEMEFHGVKDSTDMWINYVPESCCSMDRRVADFFQSVYERGMDIYQAEMKKEDIKRNRKQIEAKEKAEYERLKAKFEK